MVAWIVRLWHDTSHRETVASDDAKVIIASRVERLRAYPADIVERVLNDWPTRSKWWPDSWKDLQDALDPPTRLRRAWIAELDHMEAAVRSVRIAPDADADAARAHADESERVAVAAGLRGLVVQLSDARRLAPRSGRKQGLNECSAP